MILVFPCFERKDVLKLGLGHSNEKPLPFCGVGRGLRDYQIYSNIWAAPTGADCRQVLQIKLGCEGSFHKQHLLIKNNRVWVFFYIRKQPLHLFLNGIFQRERKETSSSLGGGLAPLGAHPCYWHHPSAKIHCLHFPLYLPFYF